MSGCRRRRIGGDPPAVRVADDVAHFTGLQMCGSIWSCTVCGPAIRQRRAEEINAALVALINTPVHWGDGKARARSCPIAERDQARPGTALLLTLTMPHDWGEALADLLETISAAHSALCSGRAYQEDRANFSWVGYIRAHDTTIGQNGWHPHLHSVLTICGALTAVQLLKLKRRLYVRWARSVVGQRPRAGERSEAREGERRVPSYRHGIDLEQARSVEDVARYAATLVGDEVEDPRESVMVGERSRVGLELTRSDLKTGYVTPRGNRLSRTPLELLRDIRRAPKCDSDGVVNEKREYDLARWREWEHATHGKHAIRWSDGLKAILGVVERADEDIVGEEVGGEQVHEFTPLEWWAVCGTRGAPTIVLERAEEGGAVGVREYLAEIVPAWEERKARDHEWRRRHPELYDKNLQQLPRRVLGPLAE